MANIDRFLQRNKDFAATGAHEGASIIARHQVYVITCLDPRTRLRRHHWPGHHTADPTAHTPIPATPCRPR
jgi:hypothetical protein